MPVNPRRRKKLEKFLTTYHKLREALKGNKPYSSLVAKARSEDLSLSEPPSCPDFFCDNPVIEKNGSYSIINSILDDTSQKKFIQYSSDIGSYLENNIKKIDLEDDNYHPLVAVLLDLALAVDCDIPGICRRLLKKIDESNSLVLSFFVISTFREYLTLTWFSERSRKNTMDVDGLLIQAYRSLVSNKRRSMKKRQGKYLSLGSGNTELELSFHDESEAYLSRRLAFIFMLQNSVSLYFIEDDQYREKTLATLLDTTDHLFGNCLRTDNYGFTRSRFLKMIMLSAAGEDERAVRFYEQEILKELKTLDKGSIIPERYYSARSSLIAGEYALSFSPKDAVTFVTLGASEMIHCTNLRETGLSLVALSDSTRSLDNADLAFKCASFAQRIFNTTGMELPLASARTSLAWALFSRVDLKESEKFFKKAGRVFKKKGDTQGYIEALMGILSVSFRREKRRKAKKILKTIVLTLPIKQYPGLFRILKEEVMAQSWLKEDNELGTMFEAGRSVRIRRKLVKKIIAYAKDSYPNEFGAALVGKEVLEELELLYSSQVNRSSVMFSKYDGAGSRITVDGFVHSHPSGAAIPSRADIRSFTMFVTNLIIGYPFTENSIAAYDRVGNRLEMEIVD